MVLFVFTVLAGIMSHNDPDTSQGFINSTPSAALEPEPIKPDGPIQFTTQGLDLGTQNITTNQDIVTTINTQMGGDGILGQGIDHL